MTALLPYHKKILEDIHDPANSELLVLARGLGLRRIVCTLMKIYDSPTNLILLVNATQEEESGIGEELSIMGCRKPGLRIIGYETGSKERQSIYKGGGLISVTSRILVVDMLQSDIPIHLITGILVLHAERITPLVIEAFIVRLYREKNKSGFLKAFTDQPERITSGLSPLKNIMKELQIRKVHIFPRFQEDIKSSLERRRADVVELAQNMTESMSDIHHSLIQCMTTTLSELKRSNTNLDLDDLNVENAYFSSFDLVVRRQLDPVWHKVGPKTKQLVKDLATLRQLLHYLLTYDPIQYHAYLETIITSNSISVTGGPRQHQSPWLLTDAANIIFKTAKRRCYLITASLSKSLTTPEEMDLCDDEDAWDALDEMEGRPSASDSNRKGKEARPKWIPAGMDPVLEELPKWNLLGEVLLEIEQEIIRQQTARKSVTPGSDTVLVMTSSTRSCQLLRDYLSMMDNDAPRGEKGRRMLLKGLRGYLWWKRQLSLNNAEATQKATQKSSTTSAGTSSKDGQGISDALKRKDKERAERAGSRRRIRGGATAPPPSRSGNKQQNLQGFEELQEEADHIASFLAPHEAAGIMPSGVIDLTGDTVTMGPMYDFDNFGLIPAEEVVVIRAYSDDSDDRLLAELQPKFIVMIEPCMEFIRRIEVYRSSNPGLALRVYHMVYSDSCEEHKYLAAVRKEKESFERLIKERATMLLPILEERREGQGSDAVQTISSRLAGGRKELATDPSRVVVDMREFRSTLPSLLHAASLLVVPATLTVGDYILTPDICVERKSLADLVSSFNSGRLYTQCELMSVHYKYPVLLIEFEEDKAFSLDLVSDLKSYVKPTGKYPAPKPKSNVGDPNNYSNSTITIQSKLVLLTLSFPRLRIIWSSSPHASAEIFRELKVSNPEPNPEKAIATGTDDDNNGNSVAKLGTVNTAAEELLRCLPGINAKNIKYVMGKVGTVRELCEMGLPRVQEILGVEPGKACWEFMHQGDRQQLQQGQGAR
ncbi:hypothetical protein AMATHDRAFT_147779 [Amanita thiersii Skay4041]|uniref:ERCC4 domain-containing protein n=1 Tax=Amanita thiersii Skay4041 TaxID=703135 RepID=A0A2A9NM38_9AGAR|nr:hypothetical protein AMATHDRAFT_147779 [Amanita thiersii Skay4041]